MYRIARMDPQPDEHGVFSTTYVVPEDLDERGYARKLSKDWYKEKPRPRRRSVFGVFLAEPDDFFIGSLRGVRQGRFSPCPIEVSVEEWLRRLVDFHKYPDGWYWVRTESRWTRFWRRIRPYLRGAGSVMDLAGSTRRR